MDHNDARPTTQLWRHHQMARRPLPQCHGGVGALDWTEVFNADASPHRRVLKFIHDDILPPGSSVGEHTHAGDEEYYYILEGEGEMTLDGVVHKVTAGDLTAVFPGGSHALKNTGSTDMRILVICAG